MTMRVLLIGVVSGVVFGQVLQAQPGLVIRPDHVSLKYVDATAGLSLERAIAHALEHEPSLRAARADIEAARGMRLQAGLRPNPTVSFFQQEEPAGMDRQTRVEVAWPLDLFRKTGRINEAEREVEARQHAVANRERLLAAEVRTKYGEVAVAVREVAVLEDLIDAVSKQHALVAARAEQGATPPLERDVLRVELQRLEAERLLRAGAVERAMIELKQVLGMSVSSPLAISEPLEQLVAHAAGAPLPADNAAAAHGRSDVQEARSRVQVAEAQIDRSRREGRIDVNLVGMYMRMDAGFPQRAFGGGGGLEPIRGLFHYVAAGATVTVPLRDRKQGEIAAAEAQRAGASSALEATQLAADAEAAAARVRDEHARRAVGVYTTEARSLARQNLTVVGQTYELGRATIFDVLAEQRRYLELERAFTNALREAYEARQALRRALGEVR
jgi:cobalt-zinc-cadmium efflux system outer membrane protein